MTTAFAEEAVRVRETGHLSDRDIARATGAGVSPVGAWLRRTRSPSGAPAARLVQTSAILQRAARVADLTALCLFRTAEQLDGVRPLGRPSRHDEPPAPPRGLRA